jgi:hypothetical protein
MRNSQEFSKLILSTTDVIKNWFKEKSKQVSAETLGWTSILFIHGATIPALLALMTGLTDNPPPVDVILMVWTGLILLLAKAAVQRDMLNMITIGLGFFIQAVMMVLIFFK